MATDDLSHRLSRLTITSRQPPPAADGMLAFQMEMTEMSARALRPVNGQQRSIPKPVEPEPASVDSEESEKTGWDPYEVWLTRIQRPRAQRDKQQD